MWDISDTGRKGYLDKQGFYVALKMVSLAQAGFDVNIRNILMDSPAPKVVSNILSSY